MEILARGTSVNLRIFVRHELRGRESVADVRTIPFISVWRLSWACYRPPAPRVAIPRLSLAGRSCVFLRPKFTQFLLSEFLFPLKSEIAFSTCCPLPSVPLGVLPNPLGRYLYTAFPAHSHGSNLSFKNIHSAAHFAVGNPHLEDSMAWFS